MIQSSNKQLLTESDEKLVEAYIKVEDIEEKLEEIKNDLKNIIPSSLDDLCNLEEIQMKLTAVVSKLLSLSSDLLSVQNLLEGLIDTKGAKIVLKKLRLLSLEIDKLSESLKIKISRYTKKMLAGIKSGKGSAASSALTVPIATLQVTATTISKVLLVLENISKIIATIFPISAQSIMMFPTPKSALLGAAGTGVIAEIANANKSAGDRLSEAEDEVISEIEEQTVDKNRENSVANILKLSVEAAQNAAGESEMSFGDFPELAKISTKKIMNLVQAYLMTCPEAEPLPKYEDMLVSPGFYLWLQSGFELMMQKSFGFPE